MRGACVGSSLIVGLDFSLQQNCPNEMRESKSVKIFCMVSKEKRRMAVDMKPIMISSRRERLFLRLT